ncbi:MAG: Zn-dependent hydrolase [Verrucomicrobiae bacterium]|nr:Zn-dependent hydrolase [Verrucomicrobiae bacterium]
MAVSLSEDTSTGQTIDNDRLKRDILELAEIGRNEEDRGLYRMAFTEADMEAKQWLLDRMKLSGIKGRLDGAANVIGRIGPSDPNLPSILIGSHTDTVPRAGMLDGALGVLCGLEVLRILKTREEELTVPVELISFTDEEGRFGGMLGSEAFCGLISPETLYQKDLDGIELRSEMEARGLNAFDALNARRTPGSVRAYYELHIEQGPVLDEAGESVGIVEAITGLFKWLVRFRGEANHAGTTPMHMRHDAFMGLADFAHEIPRILEENGSERSRATIGKAQILPGAPNTVPGEVEFSLDVRDTDPAILDELADAFRKALSAIARRRDLMLELEMQSKIEPVACDPDLVANLEKKAGELDLLWRRMPSGAAHDAQIVSHLAPVAMLFVPSRDGQSHSPSEWTDWEDIFAGARLLLESVRSIACEKSTP